MATTAYGCVGASAAALTDLQGVAVHSCMALSKHEYAGWGLNTESHAVYVFGISYTQEGKSASESKQTRRNRRQAVDKRATGRSANGAKSCRTGWIRNRNTYVSTDVFNSVCRTPFTWSGSKHCSTISRAIQMNADSNRVSGPQCKFSVDYD